MDNWYKKAKREGKYFIFGLIASCFKKYKDKMLEYGLEIEEKFDGDPWVASLRSIKGNELSTEKLKKIINDYQEDPDHKGVPYYFCVRDIENDKEYVIFNDDGKLVPINNKEEIKKAINIGLDKGLVKQQLDF